jgi:hypothetical protein
MTALLQREQNTAPMMALVGNEVGDVGNEDALKGRDTQDPFAREANQLGAFLAQPSRGPGLLF